jgi:hypothetical protein
MAMLLASLRAMVHVTEHARVLLTAWWQQCFID